MLSVAMLAACTGCTGKPHASLSEELSLAAQIAAVKDRTSDQIQVEEFPVADAELTQLAGLDKLRVLLLDHPDSRFSASGLLPIAALPAVTHLRLRGEGIDDAALAQLARMKSLQILNIPRGTFTDEGLAVLKQLPHLVQLRFGSKHITDRGMQTIAELPALLRLHLIDVPITDAGLKTLSNMQQLESLYIDGGQFSDAALDRLFQDRPRLHVHLNQEHHDRDPHRHEH